MSEAGPQLNPRHATRSAGEEIVSGAVIRCYRELNLSPAEVTSLLTNAAGRTIRMAIEDEDNRRPVRPALRRVVV